MSTTNEHEKSCTDRWRNHLDGRLDDLRKILAAEYKGEADPDLGPLNEYGLSFDYVAPDTFGDQPEGYFRYQLSWGGPSDEFRIFVNPNFSAHTIEYWFMDWGDGHGEALTGEEREFMMELYGSVFQDSAEYLHDKAMED